MNIAEYEYLNFINENNIKLNTDINTVELAEAALPLYKNLKKEFKKVYLESDYRVRANMNKKIKWVDKNIQYCKLFIKFNT